MRGVPQLMRAVLLKGHGGFEQLEYREDVPVPVAGSGEVLIRVGAAAINNTDINTRTGWYSKAVTEGTTIVGSAYGHAAAQTEDSGWTGAPPVFPRIQGADACGLVVAGGAGVDPARIGERVLVEPAAHAYRVTSSLTDVELASFPCAYSAAENLLSRSALRSGETVLVTGASGGVGSAAVQLATRRRATVLAVTHPSKGALVGSLGASRVLARDADLVAELGRESVDVVVDVVGGRQFGPLLDVLRRGGRYATAGAIAGPIVALDLRTLYLKDLRLLGCTMLDPGVFVHLVSYIERGELRPVVSRTYPMSAIIAAQQDFLSKQHAGKIVLLPSA
jgi:NADPH:quinone reductase-like Zn-dependent oxidoreductase